MYKILYLFLLTFLFSFSATKESELSIEITGINLHKKGNLRVGVFKKEGYPIASKIFDGKVIPVHAEKMHVLFPKIISGTYAIIVVQDQDKNGKLTKNALGVPIEPYGFSNNKFGTFGPPDFEEVSFKLEDGKKKHFEIRLKS